MRSRRREGPETGSSSQTPGAALESASPGAGRQMTRRGWRLPAKGSYGSAGTAAKTRDDYLSSASLPRLKPRAVAHAHSESDVETGEFEGTSISSPVGSGRLGAVNRFTTDASGSIVTSELDVIGSKRLHRVASGSNTIFAQEVDAGRIAVRRRDGTVGIYDESGKVLLEVKPSSIKG